MQESPVLGILRDSLIKKHGSTTSLNSEDVFPSVT